MKTILFVIVILSLFAVANGPACPGGTCPTKPPPEKTQPPPPPPPPPTEPPEITEPPEEPPGTEESAPTERSQPHPETQETPEKQETPKPGGEKAEPRVIKLPSSGYGPPPAQPMSTGTIARWCALFLIGLAGIFIAGWSLKR